MEAQPERLCHEHSEFFHGADSALTPPPTNPNPSAAGPLLALAIETSNPASAPVAGPSGAASTGQSVAFGLWHVGGAGGAGARAELLGTEPVATATRHDDDLIPAIDRLARRLGIAPLSIDRIAVSIGPGGFTAVRVAVAAAKMIAEANTARGRDARCIGVPSALVAGWGHATSHASEHGVRDEALAVALACKGDSVHLTVLPAGWRTDPASVLPGTIAHAADVGGLAARGVRTLIADAFLTSALRDAATGAGVKVLPPAFDAAACLEVAALLLAMDALDLLPLYPREPEAVTLWRLKKKA
ncbi:MAG: hypothetical protein ACKVS8_01530 [Phycisphaerales bacterium]